MDFYKRVAIVCQQIPYGKVATYGQIALLCQKPQNARQVGYALRHKGNLLVHSPLLNKTKSIEKNVSSTDVIPAHRVVNHQGMLSGAAAFREEFPQKRLLEEEGVIVSPDLKVDLSAFGWRNSLDDALLLEAIFKKECV